jgi:hypothetical protein
MYIYVTELVKICITFCSHIIICKTALFEPYPSLGDYVRLHLVFTSLDFSTIFFYRARSSALRPTPNLDCQVSVFMSPSDRMAQLYPQAPGSLFVAFYDSQGEGGILEDQGLQSVRPLIFHLSSMGGPTRSLRSRQHSSLGHWGAQTSSAQ